MGVGDNKNILKLLDEVGFFSQLENMTLKQLRQDLKEKGCCDLFDLVTIALLVYGFLAGKSTGIFQHTKQDRKVKEMLFADKYKLSKDEIRTLKLIAEGLKYDEIADKLGTISVEGVKKRVQKIYRSLKVHNRHQATRKIIKEGII